MAKYQRFKTVWTAQKKPSLKIAKEKWLKRRVKPSPAFSVHNTAHAPLSQRTDINDQVSMVEYKNRFKTVWSAKSHTERAKTATNPALARSVTHGTLGQISMIK
jgi:hypothetical protein